MKRTIIVFITLLFSTYGITQEKLNSLKAPSSPASSVLGIQPTTVLIPKSYQALEASLYSNFKSGNSAIIPNDFSLEFTPYWATNCSLSLEDYLFPKSFLDQLVRNSSFSIASTQKFLLGDSTSTNSLGIGYRTTFYFGNKSDREKLQTFKSNSTEIRKVYRRIALEAEKLGDYIKDKKSQVSNKESFLKTMRSVIYKSCYNVYKSFEMASDMTDKIVLSCEILPDIDVNDPFKFIDKFKLIVDENLKGEVVFNEYKSYIKKRVGFTIDIAYANFLNFPTNNSEFSIIPRQSFWLTPTYRFKDKFNFLKLLGVLRYDWYNMEYYKKYFPMNQIYQNNIDYGLAISTEFEKFSFQFEMVGRNSNSEIPAGTDSDGNELFRKEQQSDFQYIGSLNYKLTDQIVLSYSFGNRFEPVNNPNSTLVSSLTLNFGFGTPTKNNLKE